MIIPVDTLKVVNKGYALQKLYSLMFDLASNHRDGNYLIDEAPKVYTDSRNVERGIRVV